MVHIGRFWTNGEPFLAIDAMCRSEWCGYSHDDFERVVDMLREDTTIPVGAGRAALVGGDGVVRDDSRIEVFQPDDGILAFVQAGTAIAGSVGRQVTRCLNLEVDWAPEL